MKLSSALLLIPAAAPLAQALIFTSPDTSKAINLSEPVVFRWEEEKDFNPHSSAPWLELWFVLGFSSSSTGRVRLTNDTRIDTRKVDSWTWDAPDFFAGSEQVLPAGKSCWFETNLYEVANVNQSGASFPLETEKFEVVGYPLVDSGAGSLGHSLTGALCAGALAVVAGLA